MKKYVYSKGAEAVTVETDGLATINNFMVTGLIGKNYHGLVQAGLNFKMGDEVTIPMMLNAAKTCKCKVECYEGNELIIDESADFTSGVPAEVGTIFGLQLGVAFNEATYYAVVPKSYTDQYDYAASKASLPWLVAKFKKIAADADEQETSEYQVQVFADERQLEFRGNSADLGKLSEDKKTLTAKASNSLMFEIVKDLGILRPEMVTWFTIRFIYGGRTYEAKTYVTPGTI